jgi:type VI protein secretion system component VasK
MNGTRVIWIVGGIVVAGALAVALLPSRPATRPQSEATADLNEKASAPARDAARERQAAEEKERARAGEGERQRQHEEPGAQWRTFGNGPHGTPMDDEGKNFLTQ